MGRAPEDGTETCYGFTLDEETDVLSAFVEKDGERKTASLLIFRDDKADGWDEITYDVVFLPEEEPTVTFNNVSGSGEDLTNPSTLTIPVHAVAEDAFLLGGEGYVLALAGQESDVLTGYGTTYEDGTLATPYTEVTEVLTVTLKEGQLVWSKR